MILILAPSFITKQRVSRSVLEKQMTLLLALSLYLWGRSQALSVYPSQGFQEKAHLSNSLFALSGLPLSLSQKLLMLALVLSLKSQASNRTETSGFRNTWIL